MPSRSGLNNQSDYFVYFCAGDLFVSTTVSHYYSDMGTIEVDAYINTRRAQMDAIQTINSDELAASNGNWSALVTSDLSP